MSGHFITIKGPTYQEDAKILNAYASTLTTSKYMKHKLAKLKMILNVEILRHLQEAIRTKKKNSLTCS